MLPDGPYKRLNIILLPAAALGLSVGLACTVRAADWPGAEPLDRAISEAIQEGLTPGAVVWVESRGRRLHFDSYGARSVVPSREAMTPDTIFDCASLTKVMATAPSVMMLVEDGKIRLNDPIRTYLPAFKDRSRITVLQLLTHYSGLRPTLDQEAVWSGYETGLALAFQEAPVAEPGSKFIYSDINYILLSEIIRQASGIPIDQFVRERIFGPLGMHDTMYLPPETLRERIAPTERLEDGTVLRGVVHDPTTRQMGGVSGHAGLFSTASDIARFARMMAAGGELDGIRILSPLSVLRMRTPQSPAGKAARGIGWDIDTPYSSPRGDLFGTASYGHTGFTGPSLWIDPNSHSFVVLMTNRVHPEARTSVVRLRSFVASITAANLDPAEAVEARTDRPASHQPVAAAVRTGLDKLVDNGFAPLRGKRIGLLTNHTGVDRTGRRNIDLLAKAADPVLAMIFTPEHGLDGILDQPEIADGADAATGIPVVSLYQSDRRKPPVELLRDLDALVFDIQDIGTRFYTYITTMGYAMEAAAEAGIEFFVLDRPNPINGIRVEGPVLDEELESFVGYHPLPVRHGMTIGELAGMFNEERDIGVKLSVIRMQEWRRESWFDETGLPWINPSPNIRTLDQATLYPGIAMLEWMNEYSVGRGTDTPFQFIGADWIRGRELAEAIRHKDIPGVRVYSRKLRPRGSVFEGTVIDGVQFTIVDRDAFNATRLGLTVAAELRRLYPEHVDLTTSGKLIGNRTVLQQLVQGLYVSTEVPTDETLEQFKSRRRAFLLY